MYSTFIFALERSSSTISALTDESSFEISFIFIFIKSEKITEIDKSEYIKKYSFENIENLSKLKSYVRLKVNNLNLDLETPYKLNDIEEISPTVMGFSRWDLIEIDWN